MTTTMKMPASEAVDATKAALFYAMRGRLEMPLPEMMERIGLCVMGEATYRDHVMVDVMIEDWKAESAA